MNIRRIALFVINCLNEYVSTEKLINTEQQKFTSLVTPEVEVKKMSARVDINELLARVRKEKKKENKLNMVFFSLFASLILVVGIILSF
jgi:hypothetical protein